MEAKKTYRYLKLYFFEGGAGAEERGKAEEVYGYGSPSAQSFGRYRNCKLAWRASFSSVPKGRHAAGISGTQCLSAGYPQHAGILVLGIWAGGARPRQFAPGAPGPAASVAAEQRHDPGGSRRHSALASHDFDRRRGV